MDLSQSSNVDSGLNLCFGHGFCIVLFVPNLFELRILFFCNVLDLRSVMDLCPWILVWVLVFFFVLVMVLIMILEFWS